MAALWQSTVSSVKNTELLLNLRFAHPDAGEFSSSKAFALRLIYEKAWDFDDRFQYRALGPLGEAITEKNIYNDRWLSENVDNFIADVKIEKISGTPYREDVVIKNINDGLLNRDLKQETTEWEQAFDNEWADFWKNSQKLPLAIYRITTTSAKWLDHLSERQTWSSAAF